jgi:hypothetical protein
MQSLPAWGRRVHQHQPPPDGLPPTGTPGDGVAGRTLVVGRGQWCGVVTRIVTCVTRILTQHRRIVQQRLMLSDG